MENPKDFTKSLLELMNEFSKIAGYTSNIQKSVAFLYTNNEVAESRKRIQGIDPIYDCTENHKIYRNKPNQRGKRSVH